MKRGPLLALAFFLWVLAPALHAFGKNKVIAHSPRWRVVSTAHFDIHFAPETEALLPQAARVLERAYDSVTKSLNVPIKERTPFFLYPNHNLFEENNIVDVGEGTGGVTEAFKNRLSVFHSGSQFWLEQVITHEFGHVAEFEVLYGGFWKSARLLKSPLYPLWFMEGIAEYGTGDLDRIGEDLVLRDAATSGRLFALSELHGFDHLKPHQVTQAYKQGCAAVRFLADEYGPEKAGEALRLLRERFEIPSVISDLTRQDFRSFDKRYVEYLTDRYAAQAEGLEEPGLMGERLTQPDLFPVFNTSPALSPDGRTLAYFTDAGGTEELALYDFKTGRHRRAAGREWTRVEYIQTGARALAFSPDSRWLAFVGEKEQRDYLYLYDVKHGRLRRVRTAFEEMRSPVFSPDGSRLAVVALGGATNDLYEISARGKTVRRLTQTANDKSGPAYSPDGTTLVYSREDAPAAGRPGRDLVSLDLATLQETTLTQLPNDETEPAFTPDGRSVVFVGTADGIPNLYRLDLPGGQPVQLTRVVGGNFSPVLARDGRGMVFVSYRKGSRDLYWAKPELWQKPPPLAKSRVEEQVPGVRVMTNPLPSPQPPAPGPAFANAPHPYRFRASTDLFFPLFYYSSTDGLYLAMLWQASEYLGHHKVGGTVQYGSGNSFLDYDLSYSYVRYRPQLFLRFLGQNAYQDFAKTELRRDNEQSAGVSYPLNRFHRLETSLGAVFSEDRFDKFPQLDWSEREKFAAVSLVRDTVTGRYLTVTAGDRFQLGYQQARPSFLGGDRDYRTHFSEVHLFVPAGRESVMAFRALGFVSTGDSPQLVRLGGVDRLRGYSRLGSSNQASRFVIGNLEWRIPMTYLDYTTFLIFPDFALKALTATVFVDGGYVWERADDLRRMTSAQTRHSVGAGLGFPLFILQTYPVVLSVEVAKRTDARRTVWYFSLGPKF